MLRLCIHHRILTLLTLVLGIVLIPVRPITAASPATGAPYRVFPETGHMISGPIKAFYERSGDAPIFGLPLTELVADGELTVQYFERARFELHPDGALTLTRLGSLLTAERSEPAFAWQIAAPADRTFVPQSGHSLGGTFRAFWQAHGDRAIFGYPISEEFDEALDPNAAPVRVQYFERARFELHSDQESVQLGLLGRAYSAQRQLAPDLLAPTAPMVALGSATTHVAPATPAAHNIALAARRLDGLSVAPGQTVSFLGALGPITARAGYVPGAVIIGGVITSDIGGGICQLSTMLYRAVFRAGLAVLERHPHSRRLGFFADAPGFEAAVFTPDQDLRWQNDSAVPLTLSAQLTAPDTLTVTLWGVGDGRTSTISTTDTATTATVRRLVRRADGAVLHQERVVTHYAAIPARGDA